MAIMQYAKDDIITMIQDYLQNNHTVFALGTDSTVADSTQTALGSEVFRDDIDEITTTMNSVLYRCYLGKAECNGYSLCEIGIFNDSGNMMLRKVFGNIGKTSDMDVWFEVEVIINIV
jgi:hypothetical protein